MERSVVEFVEPERPTVSLLDGDASPTGREALDFSRLLNLGNKGILYAGL